MPKPRYIVCCQERLVDQVSGLASHINVIDRLEIRELRQETPGDVRPATPLLIPKLPIAQMIVTAVWMTEPGDNEKDVYEFETIMLRTDGSSDVIHQGEFQFSKHFYRIDTGVVFTTHTKFSASGELTFESRIRKQGSDQWLSQFFPLELAFIPLAVESPADSANQ